YQCPMPLDQQQWLNPNAIFLTGATGFLGIYLLNELLQQTSATVYCLVRAEDEQTGKQRIQQRLQFYQLWQAQWARRIQPIVGDLAQPNFGLCDAKFTQLATDIDVIYHNGAQVNAMYPYEKLRPSNVQGSLTVLRLAGLIKHKPINFVSTLAVFFSDYYVGKTVQEQDFAELDEGLKGGYKQTKWVAESLMQAARERGFSVMIHRPGRILGDTQTGTIDRLNDLLANLLQAGVQMQQFPQVDTWINVAPVDYVSRGIVSLGQQSASLNQNFHYCNPQSTTWLALWQSLARLGYVLSPVSFAQWQMSVKQSVKTAKDKQLYLILRHLLRSPIYLFAEKPTFSTAKTTQKLAEHHIICPVLDETLLQTYFTYLAGCQAVPSPTFNQ
ncbi:MAG TPA: NAD-dependent epimerase/dehydratase family protein, partial [Thiothrix sp.]|nr:NAD-dependent epimerase/dehydratase family protein [Thiothrix sp.]